MARIDQTFPLLATQRTFIQFYKDGKNKRQYAEAVANPAVMDIVVLQIDVTHSDLSKVINWLRETAQWDGRAPAGFDSNKKSWGSTARRRFWADGSKICVQGAMVTNDITRLTFYFAPEVADLAMLLKLTMG